MNERKWYFRLSVIEGLIFTSNRGAGWYYCGFLPTSIIKGNDKLQLDFNENKNTVFPPSCLLNPLDFPVQLLLRSLDLCSNHFLNIKICLYIVVNSQKCFKLACTNTFVIECLLSSCQKYGHLTSIEWGCVSKYLPIWEMKKLYPGVAFFCICLIKSTLAHFFHIFKRHFLSRSFTCCFIGLSAGLLGRESQTAVWIAPPRVKHGGPTCWVPVKVHFALHCVFTSDYCFFETSN